MRPSRPRNHGFTLIEVLLATAIVALLAATLGVALHIAFRARRSAAEGLDAARAARLAMEAVGRDLQAAARPTGILQGPFIATDASGDAGRDSDSVVFTRAGVALRPAAGTGDIAEVTLTLVRSSEWQASSASARAVGAGRDASGAVLPADDSGDAYVLVRRENRHPLATVTQPEPDEVLCRHVRSFKLRYYDGTNWGDAWNSTGQNNLLPLAVEVTLTVAPADAGAGSGAGAAPSVTLTRVFRLPCGDLANTTTTGATQ